MNQTLKAHPPRPWKVSAPLAAARKQQRYGGGLIFEHESPWGKIEIIDQGSKRELHLGTPVVQTAIHSTAPWQPAMEYAGCLALAALFPPRPQKSLLLGLGGGSLLTTLIYALPDCRFEAVELHPQLAPLAERFFGLPQGPGLTHFTQEAQKFTQKAEAGSYDLIYLDLFGPQGATPHLRDFSFLKNLYELLTPQGFISLNLWNKPKKAFQQSLGYLQQLFGSVALVSMQETQNLVAFAAKQGQWPQLSHLVQAAEQLDQNLQIGLSEKLERLSLENPCLFSP